MTNFDIGILVSLFLFGVMLVLSFNLALVASNMYNTSIYHLKQSNYIKFTVGLWLGILFLLSSVGLLVYALSTTLLQIYALTNTDLSQLSDYLKWILTFKSQ